MDYNNIPTLCNTEVLVAGGGISGCSAAIAAARRGAKTLLVEWNGILGGAITAGMVAPISSIRSKTNKICFDGILWEIIKKTEEYAKSFAKSDYCLDHATELYKYSLLELVYDSGVNILFHCFVADVVSNTDGSIAYVVVATKEGLRKITAKMFIDATGDGDIMGKTAANCIIGSEPNVLGTLEKNDGSMNTDTPFAVSKDDYCGKVQPVSLMCLMGNVDILTAREYMNRKLTYADIGTTKEEFKKWKYCGTLGFEPTDSEIVPMPQGRVWLAASFKKNEAIINMSRVIDINACDAISYSDGEIKAGLQLLPIISFLQTFIPGFENSYFISSSSSLGVRESRRLIGEYVLTGRDVLFCKSFPDAVAYGSYIIDIHDPTGKRMAIGGEVDGEYYSIPYRSLITKKVKNLGTCGRSISADHVATSSTRIQGTASMTGEAIGAAAALALNFENDFTKVDVNALRKTLKDGGMFID